MEKKPMIQSVTPCIIQRLHLNQKTITRTVGKISWTYVNRACVSEFAQGSKTFFSHIEKAERPAFNMNLVVTVFSATMNMASPLSSGAGFVFGGGFYTIYLYHYEGIQVHLKGQRTRIHWSIWFLYPIIEVALNCASF